MLSLRSCLLAIAAAGIGLTAPTASAQGTITDIVAESGGEFDKDRRDYDILLNAVVTAGLAEVLADPDAEFTVFAPKDSAFVRLAKDLGYKGRYDEEAVFNYIVGVLTKLGGGDPIPVLTDILLYHVVPGTVRPIDLILSTIFASPIETALPGGKIQPFFLRLIDNDPDFKDPFVTFPLNIRATNGRIHTITRVLIPVDLP